MGNEDVKEAEVRKGEGAPTSTAGTAVHSPAAYIKGSPPITPPMITSSYYFSIDCIAIGHESFTSLPSYNTVYKQP
jgi:hypothetical protein